MIIILTQNKLPLQMMHAYNFKFPQAYMQPIYRDVRVELSSIFRQLIQLPVSSDSAWSLFLIKFRCKCKIDLKYKFKTNGTECCSSLWEKQNFSYLLVQNTVSYLCVQSHQREEKKVHNCPERGCWYRKECRRQHDERDFKC